jgi:hypothetical protein
MLLGLRQHLAVPFTDELPGNMNMGVHLHVTHLLSVPRKAEWPRGSVATPVT